VHSGPRDEEDPPRPRRARSRTLRPDRDPAGDEVRELDRGVLLAADAAISPRRSRSSRLARSSSRRSSGTPRESARSREREDPRALAAQPLQDVRIAWFHARSLSGEAGGGRGGGTRERISSGLMRPDPLTPSWAGREAGRAPEVVQRLGLRHRHLPLPSARVAATTPFSALEDGLCGSLAVRIWDSSTGGWGATIARGSREVYADVSPSGVPSSWEAAAPAGRRGQRGAPTGAPSGPSRAGASTRSVGRGGRRSRRARQAARRG
jgi:hypothetical protein